VQTSMAETQRRAVKDQADAQLNMAKLEQKAQADQAKLQADIVMNTEDNLVNERIKTAELTRDAADLQNEQVRTALDAQRMVQTSLGA
jgi:VIT1/CCC1 family predicted Fe2+/Mn2+ transporter